MPSCAAINCSRKDNKTEREKGFTFHRFPHKHPQRLRLWLVKLRRENYYPSPRALLCSAHFEESCFYRCGRYTELKEDALPTKFDFPEHLLKTEGHRRKEPRDRGMSDHPLDTGLSKQSVTQDPDHPVDTGSSEQSVAQDPDHPVDTGSSEQSVAQDSRLSTFDHQYHINVVSPRKRKRKHVESFDRYLEMQKKLKLSNQQSRRLEKKVAGLSEIINTLQEKGLVSEGCVDVLQKFAGAPQRLLERAMKKNARRAYDSDLRAFAITLQFYSTKAYNFVREAFNMALPHPAVIRSWYSSFPGSPGFTQAAFSALQLRVEEATKRGRKVVCALMLSEMAVRKHVQWDGKQCLGYVSIGSDDYDDSTPVAKDALVVMVVAVNDSWKVPCGYFFINGMTGQERANLIETCLHRLHDVGVQVISLTCDGPSCHVSMLKELGASLDPRDMKPCFPHPSDASKTVYVLLDSCHMLKLVRNTLGDLKLLVDKDGKLIQWNHIVALNDLQNDGGVHLASKLGEAHVQWQQQKMKVSLAAQVLNNSVANAIEFCSKFLQLWPFLASEGTVKFIRIFDKLFDILNSRHPLGKGMKAPMRIENVQTWGPFLTEAEDYILGLQDQFGTPVINSRRKTAFIGFLACIKSVRGIFTSYVACQEPPLKYLLTYRMSQDHLELFFCALRAQGRANNNPTAQQFTAAFRRLLMRHNMVASGGNCTQLDKTSILEALPHDHTTAVHCQLSTTLSDITVARKYDLDLAGQTDDVTDEEDMETVRDIAKVSMSEYKSAVVAYMAEFVCKMAKKKLSCQRCTKALCADDRQCHDFITLRDKGGLQRPSSDVVAVCKETDSCIQKILQMTDQRLPQDPGLPSAIASSVLAAVHGKVFSSLNDHVLDTAVEENHAFILIKTISLCYTKVMFHHLGKKQSDEMTGVNIRQKLSKLVLFKHQ